MVEGLLVEEGKLFERMHAWGYQFAYRHHPESPGFATLMVAIREMPTRMHFDPETIRVLAPMEDGAVSWVTFHYHNRSVPEKPIGYSRIILKDRREKAIAFYTFGGSIRSIVRPGENIFIIQSEAPILDLSSEKDILAAELADEAEIVLAKMRARLAGQAQEFHRRMCALSPEQRYFGTIRSILAQLGSERQLRQERESLRWLLQREVRFLRKSVDAVETLEALLLPQSG